VIQLETVKVELEGDEWTRMVALQKYVGTYAEKRVLLLFLSGGWRISIHQFTRMMIIVGLIFIDLPPTSSSYVQLENKISVMIQGC
jgi:hypothetical protein